MQKLSPVAHAFVMVGLLAVMGVNLFYGVSSASIFSWDEARHGISALEMMESGNYLVNTYLGVPDYWNLKPVLSFVPMLAGFSLFGDNAFGLRFFSCLSTAMTACVVIYTSKKNGNLPVGMTAAFILLTSVTFISFHNARSGDPDAFFILLNTVAICSVLHNGVSLTHYCVACFFAALAFLTKSFHAGPLCLAIALFFFMDTRITARNLLKGGGAFLCFVLPILLWAVLRYQYDGMEFFRNMAGYDAVARVSQALEGHTGGLSFTVKHVFFDFRSWLQLAAGMLVFSFLTSREAVRKPMLHKNTLIKLVIAIVVPLIVFTVSATKLRWYAYCAYPFIAMALAYLFHGILCRYERKSVFSIALILALIAIFAISEVRTARAVRSRIKQTYDPVQEEMYAISRQNAGRVALFRAQGEWEQAHILVAKFTGKLDLKAGNETAYEAFTGPKALVGKANRP